MRDSGSKPEGTFESASAEGIRLRDDSRGKGGLCWVRGTGATAELLAAAGWKRLPEGAMPGESDVVIHASATRGAGGLSEPKPRGNARRNGGASAGPLRRPAHEGAGVGGRPAVSERRSAQLAGGHAGAWHWNEGAVAIEALPLKELDRRLTREGFRSALAKVSPGGAGWRKGLAGQGAVRGAGRQYAVTVFGMEAPVVRPDPGEHVAARELTRRLGRSSARALYTLGLEMGTVTWEVDGSGRKGVIIGLTPAIGELDAAGERSFAEAASAFAARWREDAEGEAPTALIGADPEFVMLAASGRVVPASRYFASNERAGCDSVVVRGVQRWPLAELRPRPAAEPGVVAGRIRRLLQDAAARTAGAGLRWRAGAMPVPGLPLGGHLHFSGVALTGERLRALDNAVALPLRLLEPGGAGRRRPRYGALGDFRPKAHGGFEYRTPPSWLVSPRLALGVLALAKLAADNARALSSCRPLDDDALRDAFYGGELAPLRKAAASVQAALESLPDYAKYREAVEPLFVAAAEGRVWDENADIRRKWRIPE